MAKYPNRTALYEAHNIYRDAMREFIPRRLRKVPRTTYEKLITRILNIESNDRLEGVIDIGDFPRLIRDRDCWINAFSQMFGSRGDLDIRGMTSVIADGRKFWAHPGTEDIDSESTRTHLSLVAEVLGGINKPDAKREVEDIRNRLFSDESEEHPLEAENAAYKEHIADMTKQLEAANAEKIKYEKVVKGASNQLATLKSVNAQLETRLETTSTQLADAKKELAACNAEREERNEKVVAPIPPIEFPYTGSQLRDYRKKAGLTQVAVALALGLSKGTAAAVGDWEADRVKVPPKHYTKLKKLYGLEVLLGNGKTRKKKSSIAKRYAAETTGEERNELAVKIAELRINEEGTKPLAWRKIREELGLKKDEFHQVIRPSAGYREAVVNRIKSLKARDKGWEYSGKLEVLTGIEIAESELK